jgi:RinA family phage transcriptional activator
MKRSVFKYIEGELFIYPETLKEIDLLREEIMTGSGEKSNVRVQTNRTSDPTGQITTRLLTDRRLRRLEEVRDAIQSVYDKLPEEQQNLV